MHPVEQHTQASMEHPSAARRLAGALISLALALIAAVAEKLYELACSLLVYLAADPYPAGKLYDPSEDYELAREVLAMENLITGRFGSIVGPGRIMRLFGGIEILPGLLCCTAAMRTTDAGDDVFLSFELDHLMLDDHDGEHSEYSVQVIRTPAAERWKAIERQEFSNAVAALVCFFSDEPVRIPRD